jgi:hypothetical protein
MNESLGTRLLLVAGLAVAVFLMGHGLALALGIGGDWDSATVRTIFGLLQMVAASAVMVGLLVSPRRPALGMGLVALAAIAMSAMWYWFLVITIPVGIALVAIAYARGRGRARRFAREREAAA